MQLSGEIPPVSAHGKATSPEDVDLVARARQGDDLAWEALVRQHQEAVFRLAYLFLGDADESEDVAQECFIRAYHALGRFDSSRPMLPWLLSIAANLARNRRRSIGRFFKMLQTIVQNEPHSFQRAPGSDDRRWQSQELKRAVERLGTVDQQVVYMRYFLELSVEDTANSLGIAPGTVKSRLYRALERLRKVIEKEHPDLKDLWI
jgi:RNA polymerase sigma factor (sigma-70 family)